jgi:hypothetical protein
MRNYTLKYPEIVYDSAKVNVNNLLHCSDLRADYELCRNGFRFMEEPSDATFKSNIHVWPKKDFEKSTISDGKVFYRAKNTSACDILYKRELECTKHFREKLKSMTKVYYANTEKFKSMKLDQA